MGYASCHAGPGDGQRETLTVLSRSAPVREVQRAKALLMAADGVANYRIGEQVGVSPATVAAWRDRFVAEGSGQVRAGAEGSWPQAGSG